MEFLKKRFSVSMKPRPKYGSCPRCGKRMKKTERRGDRQEYVCSCGVHLTRRK